MLKKILIIIVAINLASCAELSQILNQSTSTQSGVSQQQIGMGLKEALTNGIVKQVMGLTKPDGFFKDQMVKINYPSQLQKVDKTLRDLGMGSLSDQGLKLLNRAAERAVSEAIPIFKNAIANMSFSDAKQILMGSKTSATDYLKSATSNSLRAKFYPIIEKSFSQVGADKLWGKIINTYNQVPLVEKVNPDLTSYVTDMALEGVFKKVAVEEGNIRTNVGSRTSDLLRNVFSLQD